MKIKSAGPYSCSLGYPAKRCTHKGDPRFYCKHGATKHKIRRLLLSNGLIGVPRINISFSLWARRVLPECVLVPVCSWSTFKPICFSRGQKQWSYLQSHWNCCLKHPLHSGTFYCSDLLPFDPASPALDKRACFGRINVKTENFSTERNFTHHLASSELTLRRRVLERWTTVVNFLEVVWFVCVCGWEVSVGEYYEVFICFQLMGGPAYLHFLEAVWVLLSAFFFSNLLRETDAISRMKCYCSSPANTWQFYCPCPYLLFRYLSLGARPIKQQWVFVMTHTQAYSTVQYQSWKMK